MDIGQIVIFSPEMLTCASYIILSVNNGWNHSDLKRVSMVQ